MKIVLIKKKVKKELNFNANYLFLNTAVIFTFILTVVELKVLYLSFKCSWVKVKHVQNK